MNALKIDIQSNADTLGLTLELPVDSMKLTLARAESVIKNSSALVRVSELDVKDWEHSTDQNGVFKTSIRKGPFTLTHACWLIQECVNNLGYRDALALALSGVDVETLDCPWPVQISFGSMHFDSTEALIESLKSMPAEWWDLGSFTLSQSQLLVSDPCYSPGTWCTGSMDAIEGLWHAESLIGPTDWGTRVKGLRVRHELQESSIFEHTDAWEDSGFDIDVDSGQCGFFDAARFIEDAKCDMAYRELCDLTGYGTLHGGIIKGNSGAVTLSGYGDGSYRCCVRRDSEGKVVAAKIIFIEDQDSCDWDKETEAEGATT